ncbi:MAG: hypothetical protein V4456_04360 [Bacteroidota bacterium]
MKKLIVTLIILLIFCSNLTKAQNQFSKRSSIIRAFVSAVFKEKKQSRFIMDNYMCLSSNDTASTVKKEVMVTHMIDTLVKKNSEIFASSDYEIFAYDNFKGLKKDFNTDDFKNIMIVAVKKKAVIYFYFYQDRIMSFFTIEKGSLSFFITI